MVAPSDSEAAPQGGGGGGGGGGRTLPGGLPMAELMRVIRERPDLKSQIQEVVQRKDLLEPAKMAAIQRIVREAQPQGGGGGSMLPLPPTADQEGGENADDYDSDDEDVLVSSLTRRPAAGPSTVAPPPAAPPPPPAEGGSSSSASQPPEPLDVDALEPSTQEASRTLDESRDHDPEIQAALLPSLCSCLRDELGMRGYAVTDAEVVERACEVTGMAQAGSLIGRARACLAVLGV